MPEFYILDTLENLIYETTNQCDLVRRRIIGFLGGAEAIRIKRELTREWEREREQERAADLEDEPDVDVPDDFELWNPSDADEF